MYWLLKVLDRHVGWRFPCKAIQGSRAAIAEAARFGKYAAPALLRIASDTEQFWLVRTSAITALGVIGDVEYIPGLVPLLKDLKVNSDCYKVLTFCCNGNGFQ